MMMMLTALLIMSSYSWQRFTWLLFCT